MKNILVAFILVTLGTTFGIGATPTKGLEVSAPGIRTLLMGAEDEFDLNQVRQKLIATGVLSDIDIHDVRDGLPSFETLLAYDSLSVHSNYSLPDRDGLGDLLADYVDAGGGVVVTPLATRTDPRLALGGRWESGGYSPINGGLEITGTWTISEIDIPTHPVLNGVEGVRYAGRFTSAGELAPGVQRIVAWQRGDTPPLSPLVAEHSGFNGRIMLFNVYPEVGALNDPGFLLLANTLHYAAIPEPSTLAVATISLAGILLGQRHILRSSKLSPRHLLFRGTQDPRCGSGRTRQCERYEQLPARGG